jgi:endonuclease/exonuclease/phosphatase family metal-dependent hydrolase
LISTEYFTQQLFQPNTFFSHETFSKLDHILGHKASLNKFKKIKITPCIISDHNGIKLDLKNKRNPREYSNTWKLSNTAEKAMGD